MKDFALAVTTIFGGAWELFSLKVPGFPFSYGDIIVATGLASASLALLKFAFGAPGPGSSNSNGRTTQNPKISKERMNDTK